jgi:stage V sporulation protein SpoVS
LAETEREQVAMAVDASSVLFRGFEAMRAIGQQAVQQAADRHAAAAGRLRAAGSGAELVVIPFELWQADLQGAGRCWQDLTGAALETQTELMECAWRLCDAGDLLQGVSAIEAIEAIPGVRTFVPAALALCQPPRA